MPVNTKCILSKQFQAALPASFGLFTGAWHDEDSRGSGEDALSVPTFVDPGKCNSILTYRFRVLGANRGPTY